MFIGPRRALRPSGRKYADEVIADFFFLCTAESVQSVRPDLSPLRCFADVDQLVLVTEALVDEQPALCVRALGNDQFLPLLCFPQS